VVTDFLTPNTYESLIGGYPDYAQNRKIPSRNFSVVSEGHRAPSQKTTALISDEGSCG